MTSYTITRLHKSFTSATMICNKKFIFSLLFIFIIYTQCFHFSFSRRNFKQHAKYTSRHLSDLSTNQQISRGVSNNFTSKSITSRRWNRVNPQSKLIAIIAKMNDVRLVSRYICSARADTKNARDSRQARKEPKKNGVHQPEDTPYNVQRLRLRKTRL